MHSLVGIPRKIRLSATIIRADKNVQLLQAEMKAIVSFLAEIFSAVEQLKLLPGVKYKNGALYLLQLRLPCLTDFTNSLKFLSSSLDKKDATELTRHVMWC